MYLLFIFSLRPHQNVLISFTYLDNRECLDNGKLYGENLVLLVKLVSYYVLLFPNFVSMSMTTFDIILKQA